LSSSERLAGEGKDALRAGLSRSRPPHHRRDSAYLGQTHAFQPLAKPAVARYVDTKKFPSFCAQEIAD